MGVNTPSIGIVMSMAYILSVTENSKDFGLKNRKIRKLSISCPKTVKHAKDNEEKASFIAPSTKCPGARYKLHTKQRKY